MSRATRRAAQEDPVTRVYSTRPRIPPLASTIISPAYWKRTDIRLAYRKTVPLYDYHTMNEQWWKQQRRNPDITWPGRPEFFALSSGTTGKKSKRIPVTDDMLECTQRVGRAQAECLANFDLPAELFEKDILMLTSSADLAEKDGYKEGEISGINVSNMPEFMEGVYKPGLEIAQIADWDERVQRIAEEAPKWDVGALAGIPSWMVMMLRKIIEHNKLNNIHDIWPNLSVYTTGGVAFEPYREVFESLLDHVPSSSWIPTWLARAFSPSTPGRKPWPWSWPSTTACTSSSYPTTSVASMPPVPSLEEPYTSMISDRVEEGVDYALIVSTPAGAWRYMIGDTIKFVDKQEDGNRHHRAHQVLPQRSR